jgi:four helix bundle protein
LKITRFEDIESWKESRLLINAIYSLRSNKNFNKDFGLRDQITRASVSIMSNIAEGFNSGSAKSFIKYLNISYGSASEVQSLIYILHDQSYIDKTTFDDLYKRISKIKNLIGAFIQYLKNNKAPKTKN